MNLPTSITPKRLYDLLLNVAMERPVFIWGSPGIGKTAIVQQFSVDLGIELVPLLGSQLAPEDIIGVPVIIDNSCSVFCPPRMIVRKEPFVLFLDELNICSHEVQKAFYSLINEKRIGDYRLPEGSIVIGAGNRQQDSAIVKTMSSALINRMLHVELRVSPREWLEWAHANNIHRFIIEYLETRPDHLCSLPSKTEEPFSSPRSWHILSDSLNKYSEEQLTDEILDVLAFGCLTSSHASNFKGFVKNIRNRYRLEDIISGRARWPDRPEDRDSLYFLMGAFREYLVKNIPESKDNLTFHQKKIVFTAKKLIKDLAAVSLEMAQLLVTTNTGSSRNLQSWFLADLIRDLPRIVDAGN